MTIVTITHGEESWTYEIGEESLHGGSARNALRALSATSELGAWLWQDADVGLFAALARLHRVLLAAIDPTSQRITIAGGEDARDAESLRAIVDQRGSALASYGQAIRLRHIEAGHSANIIGGGK